MINNFQACLAIVLKEEGGYVNNPKDPGGITNLGVTKTSWEEYVGHQVDVATMRSLTPLIVAPFYQSRFWNKLSCDDLPPGLDLCVFDFAVNVGPGRPVKYLQQMVGVQVDGDLGPNTKAAITAYYQTHGIVGTVHDFQNLRRAFYRSLPTFGTFGKGWLNRVNDVESLAIKMG